MMIVMKSAFRPVLCPFPDDVGADVLVNVKKSPQRRRARSRTRTDDPFLTMEVLYRLSYPGVLVGRSHSSASGRVRPPVA
jgi:hypothetical protein